MKVLEDYTDYREYLRDYYEELKEKTTFFSYRYFSKKAGLPSPSLFPEVMSGKRNLTERSIASFCKGLGLDGLKAEFFKALVLYNQSDDDVIRQKLLEQMRGIKHLIIPKYLTPDLYEYYSNWYNVVIRELACLLDWQGDYIVLANSVHPSITPKQAKEAIQLLITLGLLEKKGGRYYQKDTDISSGDEVISNAIRSCNVQLVELAKSSINELPPNLRHASNMIVGISRKAYFQIKREINYFHQRVTQICHEDKDSDNVYAINIQMFPTSKMVDSSNTGENDV